MRNERVKSERHYLNATTNHCKLPFESNHFLLNVVQKLGLQNSILHYFNVHHVGQFIMADQIKALIFLY
jgi:hypothetical protein